VTVINPDGKRASIAGFYIDSEFKIYGTALASGNEPSLAVDPRNSLHAVVGFNRTNVLSVLSGAQCGWAESRDGGVNWTSGSLKMPAKFIAVGDPWLVYSPTGQLFYSCIGETSYSNPLGLLHQRSVAIFVATTSTGMAVNFKAPVAIATVQQTCTGVLLACGDQGELTDHPSLVMRGTQVIACWIDNFSSTGNFFILTAASDDGQKWSSPKVVGSQGASCTVGSNSSTVAVSWVSVDGSLRVRTSANGVDWNPEFSLATTGILVGNKSTTGVVLSVPYALVMPGPVGLNAVWQARTTHSDVFMGRAIPNSVGIAFQDAANGTVDADKFLPGAKSCPSAAGAYEVTTADSKFRYKVWPIGVLGPVTPIFASGADLDATYGYDDLRYPGFKRVGDYTSVDCAGNYGLLSQKCI